MPEIGHTNLGVLPGYVNLKGDAESFVLTVRGDSGTTVQLQLNRVDALSWLEKSLDMVLGAL